MRVPWNKGKRLSRVTKKRMSRAHKGVKKTPAHRLHISQGRKGIKHSTLTRLRISRSRKGKGAGRRWKCHEKLVRKELEKQGWSVFECGWPDFICIKGKQIRIVEAKALGSSLTFEQQFAHHILKKLGVIVEVLRPHSGRRWV